MVEKSLAKTKMGKKYEKDGKMYEEGFLGDREIGPVQPIVTIPGDTSGGYVTKVFEPNITIENPGPFSRHSPGTVDGAKGTFKHDLFSGDPNKRFFEPSLEERTGTSSPSSGRGNVGNLPSAGSRTHSSYVSKEGKGGMILVAGLAVLAYSIFSGVFNPEKENNDAKPALLVPYQRKIQKNNIPSTNLVYSAPTTNAQGIGTYHDKPSLDSIISEYKKIYESRIATCLSGNHLVDNKGNVYLLSCDDDTRLLRGGIREGYLNFHKYAGGRITLNINKKDENDGVYFRKISNNSHLRTNIGESFYSIERNKENLRINEIIAKGQFDWEASGIHYWMDDKMQLYLTDLLLEKQLVNKNIGEIYLKQISNGEMTDFELHENPIPEQGAIHLIRYWHGKKD